MKAVMMFWHQSYRIARDTKSCGQISVLWYIVVRRRICPRIHKRPRCVPSQASLVYLVRREESMRRSAQIRILLTLVPVLLFALCGIGQAATVEKTFHFGQYSVQSIGEYQTVGFANTSLAGQTGEPTLPYHAVALLLPPGQVATGIELVGVDAVTVPGKLTLYPRQQARPLSFTGEAEFIKHESVYAFDGAYPSQPTGTLVTEHMNGYAFAMCTFTPVTHNPAQGTIQYFSKVRVVVTTEVDNDNTRALDNISSKVSVVERVKKLAQNPEMISMYPAKSSSSDGYDMMIITPAVFADSFQTLIDFYQIRGLEARVVTVETINSTGTGADIQEKMRNYIIHEYQNEGVEYVLLGGDSDDGGEQLVPHRGFYCYVQSGAGVAVDGIAADLYYSALDGNWNDDGDARWGEPGEADLLPDIAVGRLPFSTAAELHNMLHKTISYQGNPVEGELTNPLLVGEHLYSSPLTYGSDYLRLLIDHHEDNGYVTEGIPSAWNDIDSLYERYTSWNGATLQAKINNGMSFMHHNGHANETYVMHLNNADITEANFSGANGVDHNYTLIYTFGCLCGRFNYSSSDCIAEKMLKLSNFCVGGAFNSHYGWFNEGQTEGPSGHIDREFVSALYGSRIHRIGATHMQSKVATSPWITAPGQYEEGALRFCYYDCNMLADPALSIWTQEPLYVDAMYESTLPLGTDTVVFRAWCDSSELVGYDCVLMADEVVVGHAITDIGGYAHVALDTSFTAPTDIDLIISGPNLKPETFPVSLVSICCGQYTGGITGNANCSEDGNLTLSDITRLIDRVYVSKESLCCEATGNTNGSTDCAITLSDITVLIDAVYISKTPPAGCMPECEI